MFRGAIVIFTLLSPVIALLELARFSNICLQFYQDNISTYLSFLSNIKQVAYYPNICSQKAGFEKSSNYTHAPPRLLLEWKQMEPVLFATSRDLSLCQSVSPPHGTLRST